MIRSHTLVPSSIRTKAVEIIKHFERFEGYASVVDWQNPQDRLDFLAVIEADGAFPPEIFETARTLGNRIHSHFESRRREVKESKGGGGIAQEFDRAFHASVLAPLFAARRYLTVFMIEDAKRVSLAKSIVKTIRRNGEDATFNELRKRIQSGREHESVGFIADWFLTASHVQECVMQPELALPTGMDFVQVLQILRESEFAPTVKPMTFPMPWAAPNWPGLKGEVIIQNSLDPTYIAVFHAFTSDGQYEIMWTLSRVTGELQPIGSRFGTIRDPFEYYDVMDVYERLRRTCVAVLIRGLLDGSLREQAFVSLDRSAAEEPTLVEPVPSQDVILAAPPILSDGWDLIPGPGVGKPRRAVVRTGSLTWRRIMSAFHRLGVTVEYGTRHPKLRYGDRTTTFLNPHSQDTDRNIWALNGTLAALGIDPTIFYANT